MYRCGMAGFGNLLAFHTLKTYTMKSAKNAMKAALLLVVLTLASCGEEVLSDIAPADLEIRTETDGDAESGSKDNPPPGGD